MGPLLEYKEEALEQFAVRVRSIVPSTPDAVLLQEVSRSAATYVAGALSGRLDVEVVMGARPIDLTGPSEPGGPEVAGDTAVLLNSTSLAGVASGSISTSYDDADRAPDRPYRTKKHRFVQAKTLTGNKTVQLVSVHFIINKWLHSEDVCFCYKRVWTDRIARRMQDRMPSANTVNVIAGDFNNRRCTPRREKVVCTTTPFWHSLTAKWGYTDAVFDFHGTSDERIRRQGQGGPGRSGRIDYIFTTGRVSKASHDINYRAGVADPHFYSDHPLVWAELEI
jgi:endonuclease/exonuclease/phosphatase family metal-dependent hydrolase